MQLERRRPEPGRHRIVVVEDDPDILYAVTTLLGDEGYDVEGVRDGREALDNLRGNPSPDLLILDLMMPVMDGWEFRTVQRSDPRLASIPVLAMSADSSPKAAAIDAAGFLRKPFDTTQLLEGVRNILEAQDRSRMQSRLVEAERLATLGTLAAGAAHEISNPLAFTVANLATIQEQVVHLRALVQRCEPGHAERMSSVLDDVDDLLGDCRVGADRVGRVVRNLQGIARRQEEQHRPVDVRGVVDAAIAMTQNQIRHRARLVTRYQDVPSVHGSQFRLGQLLVNLLANAAQAIPEGHAQDNEIAVGVWERDGSVVLEVRDTGEGIAPDARLRLFEPFFTTKPAGTGMGLGLSICQSVAIEHHATIEVESEPGKGSVFRVVLPATPPTRPGSSAGDVQGGPAPEAPHRGRVLVVDDEPQLATAMKRLLQQAHDVVAVTRGRDALDLLVAGEQFDAIVCDLTMPNMTGEQLYREVERQVGGLAASRFVFVTGGALSDATDAFLEAVPNARLAKPFEPGDLRAVVQRVIAST